MTNETALREAAIALRDDMLMRAEINRHDNDGELVVEAGAGAWSRFCTALQSPAQPEPSEAVALADLPDEDWLSEAIDDSLDMDWTSNDGARNILRLMEKEGFAFCRMDSMNLETKDTNAPSCTQ